MHAAGEKTARTPRADEVIARALAVWPGLDRRKLARTSGEPARVARLVEHRTALSRETIVRILIRETAQLEADEPPPPGVVVDASLPVGRRGPRAGAA